VGVWNGRRPPFMFLAPADALVEIAIPHLAGGRLSLKAAHPSALHTRARPYLLSRH